MIHYSIYLFSVSYVQDPASQVRVVLLITVRHIVKYFSILLFALKLNEQVCFVLFFQTLILSFCDNLT